MHQSNSRGPRRPSNGGRNNNYRGQSRYNNRNNNRSRSSKGRGQYIDPSRFVKSAKPVEQDVYQPVHSFEDFAVDSLIKRNLEFKEITVPTQIQDQALPPALEGKDVIGIANTGTGKTIAFMLPLLTNLLKNRGSNALIIAPTRELALQIQTEARWLARGGQLFDVLLIGGQPIQRQLRDLQRRPQIFIGTPGRIKDHIERGTLRLDRVETVVLDEVDRMLDMGFINDIRMILSKLPQKRQSFFFSATMNHTIETLINTFSDNPVSIMAKTAETSDNVDQSIIHYFENKDRMEKLHELLITEKVEKSLIFCETKRNTEKLVNELIDRGFKADAMHGDKSQNQRQRALMKFRDNHIEILVATDVAARGIDVDKVTHVINYEVPQTYDDYTHRIGRTGRGGSTGYAVTFVTH